MKFPDFTEGPTGENIDVLRTYIKIKLCSHIEKVHVNAHVKQPSTLTMYMFNKHNFGILFHRLGFQADLA